MTTLAEYLLAERFDHAEPASFYLPGAADWEHRGMDATRYTRIRAAMIHWHTPDDEDIEPFPE